MLAHDLGPMSQSGRHENMDSLGFGGTTASFFGGLTMRNRAKNHGFFHGKNQHFMGRKKGKYWDVPLQ